MNKAQLITIVTLAILWTLGGIRLLWSGSFMLIAEAAEILGILVIISIIASLAIGFAKGKFVLQKTAQRSLDAAIKLENTIINCLLGWLKVLGVRGILVISLMIGLGIFLGGDFSPFNSFGRGLLRIAIGIALLIGSLRFWTELKEKIR
ncbi:MAG: hypothetical protein QNJ31_02320 [Candidatus Caenarcaniphilales bacterium]|nr:hypothetical protein [Candidatus Caenarcaniphilales bacterium]